MSTKTSSASTLGIVHHTAHVNGTELHYVSGGTAGSPILLVHGFPETWWDHYHQLLEKRRRHTLTKDEHRELRRRRGPLPAHPPAAGHRESLETGHRELVGVFGVQALANAQCRRLRRLALRLWHQPLRPGRQHIGIDAL